MNFQIRIRTDASFADVTYISDWLEKAARGFAFEHNKPGNHHYHVYLFGLDRNPDAMRKHLGRYLPDKECYSVGVTCGGKKRIKITPEGAYQYGSTNYALSPIWSKGFPLEELKQFHETAIQFYKPMEVIKVTREEHYVVRPDKVWERLFQTQDEYSGLTVKAIKSKMAAAWLNNGKAIPRTADLHRYSVSLYYLNKYKNQDIPATALMEEYD